uniref:Uncharacterized protein n=1 Tax=Trichobilharzia regenti TaxID=157069 RepID=A0AA85KM06_TRIRE|nr:unnamed protein product [Trichobilharzia regenti]
MSPSSLKADQKCAQVHLATQGRYYMVKTIKIYCLLLDGKSSRSAIQVGRKNKAVYNVFVYNQNILKPKSLDTIFLLLTDISPQNCILHLPHSCVTSNELTFLSETLIQE